MRKLLIVVCVLVVGLIAVGALVAVPLLRGLGRPNTFHRKLGWEAEDFFTDPKVIELCEAIERNDLPLMEKLIAEGANVNALGKGNMTPLLWAYLDNQPERFELLLKHGANPNVCFTSDFGTPAGIFKPGQSVTEQALTSLFDKHFDLVMQYGGDPNLVNPVTKDPIMFALIRRGQGREKERFRVLIEKGLDLNRKDVQGRTAPLSAVGWFQQYDLALFLLENGANPKLYDERQNSRLIHLVVGRQQNPTFKHEAPIIQEQHRRLLDWLVAHGESIQEAERDLARWQSWGAKADVDRIRLREEETAARKAKEATEREAAAEQ